MKRTIILVLIVLLSLAANNAFAQGTEGAERKSSANVPVEEGGGFTPRGKLVIEPGIQYAHYSKNRLFVSGYAIFDAILIGKIDVGTIDRDVITPYIALRYGFSAGEIEIKVPWVYRRDEEVKSVGSQRESMSVDDSSLGDIEVGLSLNVLAEREGLPGIIAHIKVKAPTGKDPYGLDTRSFAGETRTSEFPSGSGHWGYSAGLTFVKTSDPAVLFAGLTYYYSAPEDIGVENGTDFGRIEPGNSYEYNLGMAFALNEKLSMSFSFSQRFTEKTEQNSVRLAETDSNVAMFNIGGTYAVSDTVSVGLSLGIGLTEDAPDVTVLLRIPISI